MNAVAQNGVKHMLASAGALFADIGVLWVLVQYSIHAPPCPRPSAI
jgi:hypothetical protein